MRNREEWKPSKYVYRNGKLVASRDQSEVNVGSRLAADLIAEYYSENLRLHCKGRLLDLGCGKAPLFMLYRDYVTEAICVDWEQTAHRNDYIDFECDLTKHLPFENGEFDTIILSDVLEHIPQPELLWEEMSRILSVKGRIIINVPFYYWIHEHPHDYYRYTEYALRRFVERSGLKLVQLESRGGVAEVLADIVAKRIAGLPRIGRYLAMFVQWLALSLMRRRSGKRCTATTSCNFPLTYFVIAEKT